MKKSLLVASIVSSILVGCGSDSGSSASTDSPTPEATTNSGIYLNNNNLIVMMVDLDRPKNQIIVGDFANDAVYIAHDASSIGDIVNTEGLTYADLNSFSYLPDQKLTASFGINNVMLTGNFNNQNLMYTLDKTNDSKTLADIEGTHTNPFDGSTFTINADGSFIVNGACTISGDLVRVDHYFNILDAEAVSCMDSGLNGTYSGVLLTADYQNQSYIVGILGNDTGLLWGNAPIR